MSKTIQETIEQLHGALRDYIEATYHIGDPALIAQRRALLGRPGVTHQVPYLESTPRYQLGERFREMTGLPAAALRVFETLARVDGRLPRLIYDPPYKHQSDAVRHTLLSGRNLVVMTGTGSGKTESFLLPILGKLAREASESPAAFGRQFAVRALLLYPMNALVNDQLGRLRSLFGDSRLVALFKSWAGRPPRFARYTSRTPYAGVRTRAKDSAKLKSIEEFYVEIERQVQAVPSEEQEKATRLREQLKARGKWPAKPDLAAWFGEKGNEWQDRSTAEFVRAVTLPDDSELMTRHEVQAAPPDLLVTNYSMLEYMMMRPIERPIFDRTREWLVRNPDEKIMVVLDEAHLYRGAAGAEVGLLLRRLRERLAIPAERFQVICATASFTDREYASIFGAQLAGVPAETFEPVTGNLDLRPHAAPGSTRDAEALAAVDLDGFYSPTAETRLAAVRPFFDHRRVSGGEGLERDLHRALADFAPLGLLVNTTMIEARPVAELGARVFPDAPRPVADTAVTALIALGSVARDDPKGPGLLPCRVHNFFRGLPGLWVCMEPACSELTEDQRSGIYGRMYGQPRESCGCGARVLEFFTCRNCGTAYARAYSDDIDSPNALWPGPGRRLKMPGGETSPLLPLDLLLEEPRQEEVAEPADYDLETGRLNPPALGPRTRRVFIRRDRITPPVDDDGQADSRAEIRGQFVPCAVCGDTARFGRSTVQDHQTKGDQPFQALLARQIQIQPPGPVEASRFAPLRGRKVLVFSDSRQVAARLAPNLQMYSVRDSLRPLIMWGFRKLQTVPTLKSLVSLEDLYLAVLLASQALGVRLRPELKAGESFAAEEMVDKAVREGALASDMGLQKLWMQMRNDRAPEALLDDIVKTVQDRFLGLEALALASIVERGDKTASLHALPDISGVAETPDDKVALTRAWLRCWRGHGFWLNAMPNGWWKRPRSRGTSVRGQKGRFKAMDKILLDPAARKLFESKWSPVLLNAFTTEMESGVRRLAGRDLTLKLDDPWVRCGACKSVHQPVPSLHRCLDCGSDDVVPLNPASDPVFGARKGYYRNPVAAALADPPEPPMALIAAEHTAQLNAPQNDDVFSKAEENELLFQDVELAWGAGAKRASAIDVLSSTTTMEVGIDIGALSGVALRNMPPGRANYQQRAGRAGRRGNAVATVVAFGSADSHDEHYFTEPDGMIRGPVVDPKLTLDNPEIAKRHVRAFLLQSYHQERLPEFDPEAAPDLFSVLGTVAGFRSGTAILNRDDFAAWLVANETRLKERVSSWIPEELGPEDRTALLEGMISDCIGAVDAAIRAEGGDETAERTTDGTDAAESGEDAPEEGEERPARDPRSGKLLDRLLYRGVLPRYAFPTDVATFHVFDLDRSTQYRPIMRYAPSQGLPVALTQYAPGKQVWISGKCYSSGAVYAAMPDDRQDAWENRRLYRECSECGFAETVRLDSGVDRGGRADCRACGAENSFGPARYWLRPPGFAHPVDAEEVTSPDDMPEISYATRAKLTMPTPPDEEKWIRVNDRVRVLTDRQHLLVSNTGPGKEGYTYCVKCGRIEASTDPNPKLLGAHAKPYPDEKDPTCDGAGRTRHLMLGTDFITDIALFSMRVAAPLRLKPGFYPTDVALRTVSEALAKAACQMLEIEPEELMAEYRPALTPVGRNGLEAEIFLYDTLPGGAGFASQLSGCGDELFQRALMLMKACLEDCDASCYRCLRSFKNKFEHGLLDRHVGAELVGYLLTGDLPDFDLRRLDGSTALLHQDLLRQAEDGITFEAGARLPVPKLGDVTVPILATRADGRRYAIALSGPLTTDYPADPAVAELRKVQDGVEVVLVNELLVRGNLPAATRRVQECLRS